MEKSISHEKFSFVKGVVVSDTKTCENTDLKVQCVPEIDSINETSQSSNSNLKNNVQINITSEQVRILLINQLHTL
ncbi:UNVERIFIED_CONTAM: hypothetical protein NCL1_56878 [Trichonephila clavipes]